MKEIESRVIPALELSVSDFAHWERLCETHAELASPFYSPHYTRAVAQARRHVYVCVFERDSRPVGFLPFQFRTVYHRWCGAAERVGDEMTDHFGVIAGPDLRLDPAAVLRLAGLHHLNFTHLDEWQLARGLEGENPHVGLLIQFESATRYWEDLRRKNRKFVSESERKERQVQAEYGPIRFCWSEANFQEHLDRLIYFKSQQYLRTGREDWLAVPWKKKFLHTLARTNAASCQGVLSTLYAGDTWIGSHFGLRSRSLLHYWFPVYNPELSRQGPGHLLRKQMIAAAAEMGVDTIDQGVGDAPHKRIYSNVVQNFYRGCWFDPGMPALLCRAAYSVKWRWEMRKLRA